MEPIEPKGFLQKARLRFARQMNDTAMIGSLRNAAFLIALSAIGVAAISGGESEGSKQIWAGSILTALAFFAAAMVFHMAKEAVLRQQRPESKMDHAVLKIIHHFHPICVRVKRSMLIVDIEGGPWMTQIRREQIRAAAAPIEVEVRGERERASLTHEDKATVLYRRHRRRRREET